MSISVSAGVTGSESGSGLSTPPIRARGRDGTLTWRSEAPRAFASARAASRSKLTCRTLRPRELQNGVGNPVGGIEPRELARGSAHRLESLRRAEQAAHLTR